ncbi:cryptochrome/deoxyribodipyrimidine photo-lyase family protein [Rhodoferax sp.]|uniref:cryptochrome/deoxyribodipyrimidine photo-lyase family protein n=2 Tax=Rhodoferax sp. TaxID=50421 RepID=UPI00271D94EC|nr:FAD-binding domain-containing protein [Rhodoferax sp.]MDO9145979.1 FAD-binding domain-containing protein [Rhodoferax sp.]
MSYGVVWFKRDLRLHDHAALNHALATGPVLCLYLIEPSLWAQPDASAQHYAFIKESLRELAGELKQRGGRLHVRTGEAVAVLDELFALAPFASLHAHEETGNAASYTRDRAVACWCRQHQVRWQESAQFGVVRRLRNRDQWLSHWETHVRAPCHALPDLNAAHFQPGPGPRQAAPDAQALGLDAWVPPQRQRGGRSQGEAVLEDFLLDRCRGYRGGISSPLSAPTACSRLSAHLAYGNLSQREVVQATRAQIAHLNAQGRGQGAYAAQGLTAFLSRLHWHCHFIQKLESEPELEWRNVHRGYDDLREPDWNSAHFDALGQGRTGWPMVDACVAMLRETGWLNFRMRAMLVSVAAYPLWLHWREVGLWLAREFLDYEPGIHWSQLQMQSGTTGINSTRVYNPVKQAQDHDPHGVFVRRWLPALRRVPDTWLFEPWRMPESVQLACGVRVSVDAPAGAPDAWPLPRVDLAGATREAKTRLHARRAQPEVRAAKAAIVEKHASRQGRTVRRKPATAPSAQLSLDLS